MGPISPFSQQIRYTCVLRGTKCFPFFRHVATGVSEARQFIGFEVALAIVLDVVLDALARIVGAPAPTDRKRERLAQQLNDAVGAVRMPGFRDLAMKRVDSAAAARGVPLETA